ncbi:MAG TPA: hypothetical protein VML96_07020 [Egibacteraceae bacterium]|nr:hypothetical protein [Egibacteraceae bacterium]
MRLTVLTSHPATSTVALAASWASAGDSVTLVLLDAAAALARTGHPAARALAEAERVGVVVVAHDDALRRRGLIGRSVSDGVKAIDLDEVADLVVDGADKAVWL